MKLEQALRVLPDLEALMPLRALVLASTLTNRNSSALSGQNLTIGKREVVPSEMRQRMAPVFERIGAHLNTLFNKYVSALECLERDDAAAAVSNLLDAGALEERVGRIPHARTWFAVALNVAEALPNRRPEVDTLLSLGRLSMYLGAFEEAARHYQRSLVLAEAEFDQAGAIDSCDGLGTVEMEQEAWTGAQAWFARALRLADASGDNRRLGRLLHGRGELSRRTSNFAAASDDLRRAREKFEALGDAHEMARVLSTQGLLESDMGLTSRASGAYREALAWAHRSEPDAGLEVFIRLSLARLHVTEKRFWEAEEEIRRAEQLAVSGNLIRRLVQIYSLFGRLRGLQGDESGFVFFEQAIQFSRMLDRFPLVEAQVYHEYGLFRLMLNQRDESRAYLERAREIFESLGSGAELERVKADLVRLSA